MVKTETNRLARKGQSAPEPTTNGQGQNGKKPEAEFKLGRVKVILWKNEGDKGTWYNIQFRRVYKENGQWHSTDSFSRDDMPLVEALADWAFFHCHKNGGHSKE